VRHCKSCPGPETGAVLTLMRFPMHPKRATRVILTYEMDNGEVVSYEHVRPDGGWCAIVGRMDTLERETKAELRRQGLLEIKYERLPWHHNDAASNAGG
jgi:hypothetical protein